MKALSRTSSGDREGNWEGPRGEEAGPILVHLLGRGHLLPRAGRFEASWAGGAGGSGGFGLRGPSARWVVKGAPIFASGWAAKAVFPGL